MQSPMLGPAGSTLWGWHAEMVEAGYTPVAANVLVGEMVERLADRQPADQDTA